MGKSKPLMTTPETQLAETQLLRIGYEQRGDGKPLLLLHGWPDSVRTWDKVADGLTQAGFSTIAPWLRGYGPTTFLSPETMRSGQTTAFAQDAIDLLDALGIERVTVVGHDWGARAGYVLAALWPERVERLVVAAAGYETGVKPGWEVKPAQGHAYWYQWFWHTERGREALEKNHLEVCRYLWQTWAPHMVFTDEEFDATAAAWENPDWVETTLHAYRVRWGAAPKDPRYDALEALLERHPPISVPTVVLHGDEDGASLMQSSAGQEKSFTAGYRREVLSGVGHFIQRERPQAILDSVLKD